MGDRYGPVLVTRPDGPNDLDGVKVAIPGTLTTAYLALQLYHPGVVCEVMPFDQIQPAVHEGKVAAGLLIHEGQLTYADEGLKSVVDLGVWWANRTDSIAYALDHREDALDYAQQYGRDLPQEKTDQFVGMYVNELTLDYGERGRAAVERLFQEAHEKKLIPNTVPIEFVE